MRRGSHWALVFLGFACMAAPAQPGGAAPLPVSVYNVPFPGTETAVATATSVDSPGVVAMLAGAGLLNANEFSAAAHMVPKGAARPVVLESRPLDVSVPQALPPGWRIGDDVITWSRKAKASAQPLVLGTRGVEGSAMRFAEYDQLQFDYSKVSGAPTCAPQVQLRLDIAPLGPNAHIPWGMLARAASGLPLQPLSTIDAASEAWVAKGATYLIGRALGLSPDGRWRFAQDGANGVAQRRLDERIDGIDALDIVLASPIPLVQVNLVVGPTAGGARGEVLQFAEFGPATALPDGRPGARLDLRGALEAVRAQWNIDPKQPGSQRAYLKEIIVFLGAEGRRFSIDKPIARVSFLGGTWALPQQAAEPIEDFRDLQVREERFGPEFVRATADLSALGKSGAPSIRNAVVVLVPPERQDWCAVRFGAARLNSTFQRSWPATATALEMLGRAWDGRMPPASSQAGALVLPNLVAYLPLDAFTAGRERGREGDKRLPDAAAMPQRASAVSVPAVPAQSPAYRVFDGLGHEIAPRRNAWIASDGSRLSLAGPRAQANASGGSLALDHVLGPIEIDWNVARHIGPTTRFVYEGRGDDASLTMDIDLAITGTDGRVRHVSTVPNVATALTDTPLDVARIHVTLHPSALPYRGGARSLVLYTLENGVLRDAFSRTLPREQVVSPRIEAADAGVKVAHDGRLAGLVAHEPVRFRTAIEPSLDWLREVRLDYHVGAEFAGFNNCALKMRLHWSDGDLERKICVRDANGSVTIPYAQLHGDETHGGRLQWIDWQIPADASGRGSMSGFSISMSVEGVRLASALETMSDSPILRASGAALKADRRALPRIRPDALSADFWLPLEDAAVSALSGGSVENAQDADFEVDRVALFPRRPVPYATWKAWTRAAELPPRISIGKPRPSWPSLVFGVMVLIAAAAIAWGIGKGTLPARLRGTRVRAGAAARAVVERARRMFARSLRVVHALIGIVALVPGMFAAGAAGWSAMGTITFTSCAATVFVAWSRWRGIPWPLPGRQRDATTAIIVVGIAAASWAWGSTGRVAAALLPLLAAAYALAPEVARWPGRQRAIAPAAWLVVTSVLYFLGATRDFGSGRNHYFTIAAVCAVFALKSVLILVEPITRRWIPRATTVVYGSGAGPYLTAAVGALAIAGVLLVLKREPLAEHLAVVAYLSLLVGAVVAIWRVRDTPTQDA